jgi:two-component system, NarL family, uhpT operon response regulator UhpA
MAGAGMRTGSRMPAIQVAIVDDHQLVLDGIASRLSHHTSGIHVAAAESSWSAIVNHPGFPFDVVVLDLHLGDSIPVGTKVRALLAAGSNAVVMSRHADSNSITAAIAAGALAFVPKTDSADELIDAIRSAYAKQLHRPERVEAAMTEHVHIPDPGLGRQELKAIMLYAGGRSIKEVAIEMGTTPETVKSYIKRARRKYRQAGVDLGTRVLLRGYGVRQGWIAQD